MAEQPTTSTTTNNTTEARASKSAYTVRVTVSDLGRDDHRAGPQLTQLRELTFPVPGGLDFKWSLNRLGQAKDIAQAAGRTVEPIVVDAAQAQAQLAKLAEVIKASIYKTLAVDVRLEVTFELQVIPQPITFDFVPEPRCPGCGLALRTARHPELFTAKGYHNAECEARYGGGGSGDKTTAATTQG